MFEIVENENILLCDEGFFLENISFVRGWIAQKKVVVIKGFIEKCELLEIVKTWHKIALKKSVSDPVFEFGVSKNFHRQDIEPPKAAAKRIMHAFCFYPWNDFEDINLEKVSHKLLKIQYDIACMSQNTGWKSFQKDSYILSLRLTHYPIGGGYYIRHKDPVDKFYANVILIMTEKGKDYGVGGLTYGSQADCLDVEKYLKAGDVVMLDQTAPHSVEPIDPELDLSFDSIKGRWMMMWTLAYENTKKGDYTKNVVEEVQ